MNFSVLKLILIIGVSSVVIVGGSYLYKQNRSKLPTSVNKLIPGDTKQINTAPSSKPSTSSAQVLPSLPASPSSEQTGKYAQQIEAMAQDADTLTLSKCKGDPLVVKIKSNSNLTIKNTDSEGIVVYIGSENLSLAGGKSQIIQPKLSPAQYSVACQHSAKDYNGQAAVLYIQ